MKIMPTRLDITLASSSTKVTITGICYPNLEIGDNCYPKTRLAVMKNLCTDLLLGIDFQKQHEAVRINYGGDLPELNVPDNVCNLVKADVPDQQLFPDLPKDTKPIACKSKQFSTEDRAFIDSEIKQLLENGII